MKRTFVGITRGAILLSSVLLLAACGGGGGGGDGGHNVTNAAVGGLWVGTATISGETYDVVGIVAENGRGYFLQEDVVYWGTAKSSGTRITSALTGAGLLGWTFLDGSASGTGSISGTVQARKSIIADSSFTTALGTKTTGTVSLQYDPMYDDDSSLALVAGNYADGFWLMEGVFNIASNGDLFYQDVHGCVINGTVAVINPAYNVYDIQYTYSNCATEFPMFDGMTFRGLATYAADFEEFIVIADGLWAGTTPSGQVFLLERQ